jgi:hypothetical protein
MGWLWCFWCPFIEFIYFKFFPLNFDFFNFFSCFFHFFFYMGLFDHRLTQIFFPLFFIFKLLFFGFIVKLFLLRILLHYFLRLPSMQLILVSVPQSWVLKVSTIWFWSFFVRFLKLIFFQFHPSTYFFLGIDLHALFFSLSSLWVYPNLVSIVVELAN